MDRVVGLGALEEIISSGAKQGSQQTCLFRVEGVLPGYC